MPDDVMPDAVALLESTQLIVKDPYLGRGTVASDSFHSHHFFIF